MNSFLESIRGNLKSSGLDNLENQANTSLIINPFQKSESPENKQVDDLSGEYNSEALLPKNQIIPGNIHSFIYNAEKDSEYEYNGNVVTFTDKLPIVLVMKNTGKTIQGINFNLCTRDLRILILNALQNMDEDFFKSSAEEQASKGKFPLSKNILGFFQKPDAVDVFRNYLKSFSNKVNFDPIFRTYSISRIRNIRYIEPWQWSQIPFINYKQSIKQDILEFIHKSTNMSSLKLSL